MATVPTNRMVLALDYGTTYTGVSYILLGQDQHHVDINADGSGAGVVVNDVTSWGARGNPKVPSEIAYSPAEGGDANWGYEIREPAVKMIWTKLQLEEQSRLEELDLIVKALDGMSNLGLRQITESRGLPSYPAKEPIEIVTEYLSLVCQHLIEAELNRRYGPELLRRTPINLVVTCPNEWSESAKNKTFRAITKAGFNTSNFHELKEIILASEPETAALFLIRSIQQDEEPSFVKVGDCFVHCDAGGGTVDVGSFRVKRLDPDLILETIGMGAGKKCGATFVDREFQNILSRKIGPENFRRLDGETPEIAIGSHIAWGPELSELMKEFELEKRAFDGGENWEKHFALPRRLNHLNIPENGVEGGEVKFTGHDLREAFASSVRQTIGLILSQVGQVERKGSRVKFVALSGGFACSEYLFSKIRNDLWTRRIPVRRPADKYKCWPAVARGAVLHGLQTDTSRLVYMRACRRNYGVKTSQPFSEFKHSGTSTYQDPFDAQTKAGSQMSWLVRKGDLILSNNGNYSTLQICRRFGARDSQHFCSRLLANDDDEPPEGHLHNEMQLAATLNYDLSKIPEHDFQKVEIAGSKRWYCRAHLTLHLRIKDDIKFWVTFNGRELASVTVPYA